MTQQEISLQLKLQKAKQEFSDKVMRAVEDIHITTGLQVVDISLSWYSFSLSNKQPSVTVRFK